MVGCNSCCSHEARPGSPWWGTLLLEVDVDSVISRRYEGIMKNISQELRDLGIRYTGIRYIADKGIDLHFRDSESTNNAFVGLKEKFLILFLSKVKQITEYWPLSHLSN